MIDLSANENPYKHNEKEFEFSTKDLNRYIGYREFDVILKELSAYTGCDKKHIFIGPGTDYLIQKVLLNNHKNKNLVILNPNFYRFTAFAKNLNMKIMRIQLKPPEFKIDWAGMGIKNSIIVIDNPNNPTGKLMINKVELEKLLVDNIVIIDEAGFEYSDSTFVDMIKDCGNLCITRTLDKAFGLAGLKVSYMIVGQAVSEKLDKGVDINRPALSLSTEALKNRKYMLETVSNTLAEKRILSKELEKLGFQVYESQANYLLVHTEVKDLGLKLKGKEILIGDLSETWLGGYYRISVGSKEENLQLIKELKTLVI
ncbi:MAG: histidinol-phosphate aminotransferase family protein [Peptostreptococcaceae bacterium]|nr:histidinol-phosphate aminotransferase family protein [Peptostreptococcaceae bacterium]